MYQAFFGLKIKPFGMTPDTRFLYLTEKHHEALAGLIYAVIERKGFLMLTGDAGTGKTTLLTKVLERFPRTSVHPCVIFNPTLSVPEFLEMVLANFGLTDIPATKPQRLAQLQQLLISNHERGCSSALIIDEAHKLSPEVLEEVRLLGNFEIGAKKLIQILLVGQSELGDVLNRSDLRQLKQRIAIRCYINALTPFEVERYIQFRWTKAGGSSAPPFSSDAMQGVVQWSGGIPRVINAICENALMLAFGDGSKLVSLDNVREACLDLDLVRRVKHPGVPAPPTNGYRNEAPLPSPLPPNGIAPVDRYADKVAKPSFWTRWMGKRSVVQPNEGGM
jgi:general secretion pathway protein A